MLYDSYQSLLAVTPSSATPAVASALREKYVSILKQNEPWVTKLTPPIAPGVLSDFFNYSRPRFIWALSSYRCFDIDKPQPLNFLPACVSDYSAQGSSYFRALIDVQLAQPSAQPVEISYCAAILTDASYPGTDRSGKGKHCPPSAHSPGDTGHASLLIGRRAADGGSCQYLVRNSWGADCSGPKLHSLPGGAKPGSVVQRTGDIYAPQWKCENGKGDIWIDADALANSVFSVSYLDGSPSSSNPGAATAGAQPR
jgi:hypothetical protein